MAETMMAPGFGRLTWMGGAAALAFGAGFGVPVMAQGARAFRV